LQTSHSRISFLSFLIFIHIQIFWRTSVTNAEHGKTIESLLFNGGFSRIAIISLDQDLLLGSGYNVQANVLENSFEAVSGNIAEQFKFPEDTVDFKSLVTQVKIMNPELLVIYSDAVQSENLYTEIFNQGLDVKIIGSEGVASTFLSDQLGKNKTVVDKYVFLQRGTNMTTEQETLKNEYEFRFGVGSYDNFITGAVYDAIIAGCSAIVNEDSTLGPDIIHGLSNLYFPGVTGTISFDDNGATKAGLYNVLELRGEVFTQVGTWDIYNGLYFNDTAFASTWKAPDPVTSFTSSITSSTSVSSESTSSSPNGTTDTKSNADSTPGLSLMLMGIAIGIVIMFRKRTKFQIDRLI
jgi:hypothetical protein